MASPTEPRSVHRLQALIGAFGLTLLAACGSVPTDRAAPPAPASAEHRHGVGSIVLPPDSEVHLSSAPGPSTRAGAVMGVVYALVSDGIVVDATATAVKAVDLPDGAGKAAETTLRLDETYLGSKDIKEVKVVSAVPQVAMEVGRRYLLVLGAAAEIPGSYYLVEWNIFDRSDDGRWVGRFDRTQPFAEGFEPLVLSDDDVPAIVAAGRAYLEKREAAGRATMTAETGPKGDQVEIAGYAVGETVELRICVVGADFTPLSTRTCDRTATGTITPDGPSFTVTYVEPERLVQEDGTEAGCAEARCALVAYDAGWPARVWASYEA